MAKEISNRTKETYSFSAPIGFDERVHALADHFGKSHLKFSEKCVFCFEKLETMIVEKGESNGVS